MPRETLITVDDVGFAYGQSTVLEGISLTVKRGDYLGVIGPNGAGKTTLLKLMLGLLKPTSGRISLFGQPAGQFHERSRIGYVSQKATQLDFRFPVTVEEVVSLGRVAKAGLWHGFTHRDEAAIAHALKEMDITNLRRRLITELSGGQQQRAFIARALAAEPDVLMLDEPTAGVDADAQETFYELLTHLNQSHQLALILVSHDIDVVVNEVTKIVGVNKRLVYQGSPKKFIAEEYLENLYGKGRKLILHGH